MDHKVVVVGGGLAGASAAYRLAKSGISAVVLEARDRVGGRAFLKPFSGTGPLLEFGGAWITPWQHRIRSLVEEHGLSLRPRHPVTARYWLRDGGLFATGPTSDQKRAAHERVVARVASDSMLLRLGHTEDESGHPLAGISFSKYLERLKSTRCHTQSVFGLVDGFGQWRSQYGCGERVSGKLPIQRWPR